MLANNLLSTIMTEDVIYVLPNDTLDKVQDIFNRNNIHHIPVVNTEMEVVGIISKSDYLLLCDHLTLFRKELNEQNNLRFFQSLLVEEVMSKQVAKLRTHDTIHMAAAFFRENLFHAIPIIDDDDKLVGIVSTHDLLNYAFRDPVLSLDEG